MSFKSLSNLDKYLTAEREALSAIMKAESYAKKLDRHLSCKPLHFPLFQAIRTASDEAFREAWRAGKQYGLHL